LFLLFGYVQALYQRIRVPCQGASWRVREGIEALQGLSNYNFFFLFKQFAVLIAVLRTIGDVTAIPKVSIAIRPSLILLNYLSMVMQGQKTTSAIKSGNCADGRRIFRCETFKNYSIFY